ncbi:MAG TPA: discoidin domain-containing protein, partial [Anaerolineales bacterium]|nr:discoidin domain-containing protein [Anaerolineales bacterium]
LWSARRTGFVNQLRESRISVLEALRSVFRNMFDPKRRHSEPPAFGFTRTSMVLATLLVAAFVSYLAYGNRQPIKEAIGSAFLEQGGSGPSPVAAVTSTGEVAKIICKPGYLPPLCLAQEFDQTQDLTFPGNGSARPAVAKDTIPGHTKIHKAAYVNDGLYGPGASWISNSAYSWIKIDLGDVRTINTVTFGRDRLGNLNDGDPGQFVIAVAISDNVYRDGNSSNDFMEYTPVYDSKKVGFDGIISGPETIEAKFDPVEARYVKITFENAGTAVDEIEAFMLQPHGFVSNPTQRPRDTLVPASFTPVPTNTLVPSKTPTLIPTNTFVPTRTPTLIPTNTPVPTNTPFPTDTPRPTNTPRPTLTDPPPTDTPEPPPTDTPEPPPTDTPEPPPTDTSEPPLADTPEPPPSATAETLFSITDTPEVFVP